MTKPQPIHVLLLLSILSNCQQTDQQKKYRIENEQLSIRQSVGLRYGENTETLTFSVPHMSDFIIKSVDNQEVRGTMHTYWKQNNVYISSEFREGENMRLIIYEDNYRILLDKKFYVTYGFKFNAEKNKVYTLRFLDQGRISKLLAVQISKTSSLMQTKLNSQQLQTSNTKLTNILNQLKILSTLSQFSIIMSENNSNSLFDSFNRYMWYIIIEAVVILGIVVAQVRVMMGLLKGDSII